MSSISGYFSLKIYLKLTLSFLGRPPPPPTNFLSYNFETRYRKPPTKQTEAEREKDLLMKRLLDAQALIANAVNEGWLKVAFQCHTGLLILS
jgi:hypothetical protein